MTWLIRTWHLSFTCCRTHFRTTWQCNTLKHTVTHCTTLPHDMTMQVYCYYCCVVYRPIYFRAGRNFQQSAQCQILQHTLQRTATHCTTSTITVSTTAVCIGLSISVLEEFSTVSSLPKRNQPSAHYQATHTATHCNTLRHNSYCCVHYCCACWPIYFRTGRKIEWSAHYHTYHCTTHCNALQHTLQRTATHCTTPDLYLVNFFSTVSSLINFAT